MKLEGEEHEKTLQAANNYALALMTLKRFKEAKPLFRKTMPVVRRVLGDSNELTLRFRANYGEALYKDPGSTIDDLREAVPTLEDAGRIARRVLGGSHPLTSAIERDLQKSRAALRARETPSPPGSP